MRRLVIGSLAGIGALGAVSFVGIGLATRGPPAATPPTSAVGADWSAAVAEAAARRAAGDVRPGPLAVPGPSAPAISRPPAPPPPPRDSWEAVPIVSPRHRSYGLDLERLAPELAACFEPSIAARGGNPSVVKDLAPHDEEAATTLVLQIEVSGGRLWVVDAPVESRGLATDGTLSCAQDLLRRETAPARGFADGRHRLRFPLQP